MILLLALAEDPVARDGERRLRARGEDVVRLDTRTIPEAATLSLGWDARGPRRRVLRAPGHDREIDLDRVGAVWHRRTLAGRPLAVADARMRGFVEAECDALMRYLWAALDVPFVPAPLAVILAQQDKLRQLDVAAGLGFELPPTLVTSDPGEVLAFHRAHRGRCITKHLGHGMESTGLNASFIRFTEPLTLRDVAAFRAARLGPTLVQAYIDKRVELRVTVVGDRVFAAEIHSQAAAHTRHDWRKYDHARAPYFVHALPPAEAERCVALTRRLGLRYGALDLVLTPDGRYVFLEINPAGEFQWVESRTGLPITDAICDLLVALSRGAAHERS